MQPWKPPPNVFMLFTVDTPSLSVPSGKCEPSHHILSDWSRFSQAGHLTWVGLNTHEWSDGNDEPELDRSFIHCGPSSNFPSPSFWNLQVQVSLPPLPLFPPLCVGRLQSVKNWLKDKPIKFGAQIQELFIIFVSGWGVFFFSADNAWTLINSGTCRRRGSMRMGWLSLV